MDEWVDGWMYCDGSYKKIFAVVPDAIEFLFVCIDNLVVGKTGEECGKNHSMSNKHSIIKTTPKKDIKNLKTKTIQNNTTLTAILSVHC